MLKIPEVPSAKSIPLKILRTVWKTISDKPLPEVYVFTLDYNDFYFLLERLHKTPGVKDSRIVEYGIDFDDKFIEACSFKVEDYFVILIKRSAPLRDCLQHELAHVSSGDFSI